MCEKQEALALQLSGAVLCMANDETMASYRSRNLSIKQMSYSM